MRHHRLSPAVLGLALLVLLPAPAFAGEEKPLPQDPSLVQGTLENGMQYVLKRHANPEGRISLWLHVSTGSLNETEAQRGIAHYLEHMAFNGSRNFAPGTLVPFFESLGMSFGRDQNAFTSFDQTTYQLSLPDCRGETIAKGLLFLSDVGLRLSLLPKEIEDERLVILEEKRTRAGARQRVEEAVLERLFPSGILGRRLPIGTEETILAFKEQDFRDYYSTWYVPSNMTLIAVGDCDMGPVAKAIRQAFADGPKVAAPEARATGLPTFEGDRAIVVTDPELTSARLSLTRIDGPRGPTVDVSGYRRDLLERIGAWILNRRLQDALSDGEAEFLRARVSIDELAGAARMAELDVSARTETWRGALREAVHLLQQARQHGVSEREVADARTDLLADAERAVQGESTLPARALLFRLNAAVTRGEPCLSAQQELDLLSAVLPGIGADEVGAALGSAFAPRGVAFVARLPDGEGVPTEEELLQLGRGMLAVETAKRAEAKRPDALVVTPPEAGTFVEESVHEASGVWSAWCSNGARVHHLFHDERRGDATITVTLAGGEIQETAGNRGITDAALVAWEQPATPELTSTQVRDLMLGRKVRVEGSSSNDALTLTIAGDPADLTHGLQLAHLLLTSPVVEAVPFERAIQNRIQRMEGRRTRPRFVLRDATAEAFYGGVARMQPVEADDLRKITPVAARTWLRTLVATAPLEIAVVGDIDRDRARQLVATWLGSLPARERIGAGTLASLRTLDRPKGPIAVVRPVETTTDQAFVLDGFFGADRQDVDDVRRLALASRILSTRMVRTIREEKGLVYGIGAASQPSGAYPGFGMFAAQAPTDPARAEELGAVIESMYTAFAKDGPTEAEMAVARKQMANMLDQVMRTSGFWTEQIADLEYRGRALDDVVGMPEAYQALTGEAVKEAFQRYFAPERRFRFVVLPAAAGPAPVPGEAAEPAGGGAR